MKQQKVSIGFLKRLSTSHVWRPTNRAYCRLSSWSPFLVTPLSSPELARLRTVAYRLVVKSMRSIQDQIRRSDEKIRVRRYGHTKKLLLDQQVQLYYGSTYWAVKSSLTISCYIQNTKLLGSHIVFFVLISCL